MFTTFPDLPYGKISPSGEVEDNQSGTELPRTFRGTFVVINARYAYSSEGLKKNVSISGEYSGITFHISFLEVAFECFEESC